MSQLTFDEKLSRQLEQNYRRRDFQRRRDLIQTALDAQPGERILDAGCGPGFYVAELLERVGEAGSVAGVDISDEMLELARHRSEGRANASLLKASVTLLPFGDASFDAAISIQVLEFVEDVDVALHELRRVLRPGGRLVVWDVDWTTVSWHSHDAARMERVLGAWDGHLAHPALPRTLANRLLGAGFGDISVEAHAFVATEFSPEVYAVALLPAIERYVAAKAEVGPSSAAAWAAEQRELGERNEFFFACTQLCFSAAK